MASRPCVASGMQRVSSAVLLALAVIASGCLVQNISASERLRDAVVGLNDEARWSRMDLATQRVAPAYRSHWARSHHDWGRGIQIGDVELLDVRLVDEGDGALSVVAISWYRYDTMTLQRTVVRQTWKSAGREYVLMEEEVAEGDPRLLAPPPEPERAVEGDSGGEVPEEPGLAVSASASSSS